MPRPGPKKVQRYSLEFKLKAVKLSQLKGVVVQAVADALEIHPYMLSRWRKEARDGVIRGRVSLAAHSGQSDRSFRAFRSLHRSGATFF
jgi:transposase